MTDEAQDLIDSLMHYGVKGMKWGVRKDDSGGGDNGGGAKQLSARKESKAVGLETRAAKAGIRVNEITSEINALPPGLRTAYKRSSLNKERATTQAYKDELEKTAGQVRAGKLTHNQKLAIAGGIFAVGAVAAVTYSTMESSGQLNSMKLRGQAFLQGRNSPFLKNPEFKSKMSADDVFSKIVPGINPNFRSAGGQMNCRRCTFAYELRRRGYNVSATASSVGYGQSQSGLLNALSPGGKNYNAATSLSDMVVRGAKNIREPAFGDTRTLKAFTASVKDAKDRLSVLSTLEKQPVGARGEAVFNFKGFGHSLAYERFAGKTYIFDNQKGTRYDLSDAVSYKSFLDKWGIDNVSNVEFTRLDNVPLDEKFLSRWATNSE